MADTFLHDVFLSHNKANKPWVREFYRLLTMQNLSVFFDEESIEFGEDTVAAMDKALDGSKHVLLVVTPESMASHWVALETSVSIYADPSADAKKLIPILLEPTPPNDITASIRRLNKVDLTSPSNRDERLKKLLRQLGVSDTDKLTLPPWPSSSDESSIVEAQEVFRSRVPVQKNRLVFAAVAAVVLLSAVVATYLLVTSPSTGSSGGESAPPDKKIPDAQKIPDEGTNSGDERKDNELEMKFVWCPAGEFRRIFDGKSHHGDAGDHVSVMGFWLGKFEVTQEEYSQIMRDKPSAFSIEGGQAAKVSGQKTTTFPIERVSWNQAMLFCQQLTKVEREKHRLPSDWEYTLPTEAEWEYAARATSLGSYAFGEDVHDLSNYAWFADNSEKSPHPVGAKQENKWGLCDIHGNVSEWCKDSTRNQAPSDQDGSIVCRGGSWSSNATQCQLTRRAFFQSNDRTLTVGFRVARTRIKTGG